MLTEYAASCRMHTEQDARRASSSLSRALGRNDEKKMVLSSQDARTSANTHPLNQEEREMVSGLPPAQQAS